MTVHDRSSIRAAGAVAPPAGLVPVWDPLVRMAHWLLGAAFIAAYVSAEEESGDPAALHVWSGAVIGALVLWRVWWGFAGPLHARFADFVCRPVAALRYLVQLPLGRTRRYLGHSPAGGAMVLMLLASLAATVATGLLVWLAPGRNGEESALGELHGALANITLGLVILHLLGVGLASLAHRENLVLAMITGRKRVLSR